MDTRELGFGRERVGEKVNGLETEVKGKTYLRIDQECEIFLKGLIFGRIV